LGFWQNHTIFFDNTHCNGAALSLHAWWGSEGPPCTGFGGEQSLEGGAMVSRFSTYVESYAKNKSISSEKYAILGSCTLIFPVGNCIEWKKEVASKKLIRGARESKTSLGTQNLLFENKS
jgi:hypothetical protein